MKVKTRIKNLLCLLLVAVMLLGMIPAVSLNVFAAGTDGALTIGASDAAGTVYTIYGPTDWNTVATASARGNTFAGKVVRLGTSMNAAGLGTLFANFAGEFDGNGCVVSNYKAMLATATSGEASIHDLTLTNAALTVTAAKSAILVGEVTGTALAVRNVNVTGTVRSTAASLQQCGGIVGYVKPSTAIYVLVTDSAFAIDMQSTKDGGRFSATGLVFGEIDLSGVTAPASVKVDGCTVQGRLGAAVDAVGGVVGMVRMPDYDDCTVTVTNTDIRADLSAKGVLRHLMGVGGVIGVITSQFATWNNAGGGIYTSTQGSVFLEDLTIQGTFTVMPGLSTPGGSLGGVIGACYGGAMSDTLGGAGFGTDVMIRRCEVTPVLASGSSAQRIGQIVGMWGPQGWTYDICYHTGVFTIEECIIGGKVVGPIKEEELVGVTVSGAGALFGHVGFVETTVNVSDCAITTKSEGLTEFGAIAGTAMVKTAKLGDKSFVWNVTNCLTNYNNFYLFQTNSTQMIYNGTEVSAGKYSDGSLLQLTDEQIASMLRRDTDGNLLGIDGALVGGYEQHTATYTVTPEEGEPYTAYSIRFIALSYIDAPANAGIRAVAKDDDGTVVAVFDTLDCVAYDSLIGYSPSGAPLPPYLPEDYGASKLMTIVVKDIPTGEEYSFEVTPHYELSDGTTVWGDTAVARYDAKGNLIANSIMLVKDGKPQFSIVAEKPDSATAAQALADGLQAKTGIPFAIRSSVPTDGSAYIYVGSDSTLSGVLERKLTAKGYAIAEQNGNLYVCANDQSVLRNTVNRFLGSLIPKQCITQNADGHTVEAVLPRSALVFCNPNYVVSDPLLLSEHVSEYRIVVGQGTGELGLRQGRRLAARIETLTGVAIAVVADTSAPAAREILLGHTNRKTLPTLAIKDTYTVTSEGTRVYVNCASTYALDGALRDIAGIFNKSSLNLSGTSGYDYAKDAQDIRILSYNVLFGLQNDYVESEKSTAIADLIYSLDADFVGLQEAKYWYESVSQQLFFAYGMFNETTTHTPIFYKKSVWRPATDGQGNVIKNSMEFDFIHKNCWGYEWVMFEKISDPSVKVIMGNVHFCNTNLAAGHEYRWDRPQQIKEFNDEIKRLEGLYEGMPMFFAGDYNTTTTFVGNETYADGWQDIVGGTQLVSGMEATGNANRYNAIDHICVNANAVTVNKHRCVAYTTIGEVSDHLPIFIDVRPK